MRLLTFLFFLLPLGSCKPAASVQTDSLATLQSVVDAELDIHATIEKNKSMTFALAYRNQNRETEYIVVRLKDLMVVRKERLTGSVAWSGEMQLKESAVQGMVKRDSKPSENFRLIDLNNYLIQKEWKKTFY